MTKMEQFVLTVELAPRSLFRKGYLAGPPVQQTHLPASLLQDQDQPPGSRPFPEAVAARVITHNGASNGASPGVLS